MPDDHDNSELKSSTPPRSRDVHAFLCYRRNDGAWHAEWLNDHLNNLEYRESDGTSCHLRLYYDKTAPGVANWKQIHFPSLQTSHALILVCTPGIAKDLSKRGQPDWVYEELHWWTQNRRTAPIVIDATGEGDRWLPEMITRRWPDINRIDMRREDAEAAARSADPVFGERIQQRIIGSIQQSERASVFEDLERSKKLITRVKFWLSATLSLLLIAALTTALAWQFYRTVEQKWQEQRVALYFSQVALAESNYFNNNVKQARDLLESCPSDLRHWEWYYLSRRLNQAKVTIPIDQSHTKSVAFSPDGRYVASAGEDIKIWDSKSGREVRTIPGKASSVAFSPDSKRLASAGEVIKVWDIKSGDLLLALPHGGQLVAYSSDGRVIVSVDRENIELWDAESGMRLTTLRGHEKDVGNVAISPDGSHVVATVGFGDQSEIKLWNTVAPKNPITLEGPTGGWAGTPLAFSPDGTRVASGGNSLIKFWDGKTGASISTIYDAGDRVRAVAFSPDGKRLASGSSNNAIQLWDVETGVRLITLRGHEREVLSLAFGPNDTRLASASWDRTIRVWDTVATTEAQTLRGHASVVTAVTISADGSTIASGGEDGTIRVWDFQGLTELKTLYRGDRGSIGGVSFSPSSNRKLLASGVENLIKLWDIETGRELLTLQGHQSMVTSVVFSSDGKRIVSGSHDHTIKLWDVLTGKELMTFHWDDKGPYGVQSAVLSPDGTRLVAAGDGSLIRVWDVTTGETRMTLGGHEAPVGSVAYSPNGKIIASTGSDDMLIKLWDAETGRELRTFRGHQGMVMSMGFSPDSKRIVSGSFDRTIKVWSVESGLEVITLRGHAYQVVSVVFTPDGKHIISGSTDKTIKVW